MPHTRGYDHIKDRNAFEMLISRARGVINGEAYRTMIPGPVDRVAGDRKGVTRRGRGGGWLRVASGRKEVKG